MIIGNPISTGLGDAFYILTIITAPGATITAVLGDQTIQKTATDSGVAILRLRKEGTWTVTASDGINTREITVEVSSKKAETITFFPSEPTTYELIGKYTSAQTFTAPEDGYYQIELFGASGKGGNAVSAGTNKTTTGGGGGGGAYACSRVKMLAGETIVIGGSLAIGGTAQVTINSSLETYSVMKTVSGKNGANGDGDDTGGTGGAAGTASGGNYANKKGGAGGAGQYYFHTGSGGSSFTISGGAGGTAGYTGGNAGGAGGSCKFTWGSGSFTITQNNGSAGKKAFINIYRGNTNVVA